MNAAEERVLEQALQTAFGAPLADLSAEIVARWRADEGPRRPSPANRARRILPRLLPRLVVGALAACAGLVILWLVPSAPSTKPLALSDVPLLASEPGAWRPLMTRTPGLGQTLGVEHDLGLTFVGGTRLDLVAGSVLRLEPDADSAVPAVRLLAGEVTLTGSVASALRIGDAQVALAPDACVRARTAGFDDPYLIPLATRPTLARNLHMNRIAPAAAALVTLLSGSAVLTDAVGSRTLALGTPVDTRPPAEADPVRALLAQEVGTWDLVLTDYRDGKALPSRTGTEVCTLPSTGEWLISDLTIDTPVGQPVWAHVVLGYQSGIRRFGGSLVDSFGGDMALLDGAAGDEPTVRVVEWLQFDGEPYDTRSVMRWVSDDERVTSIEERQGDNWVRIRETVHRRRGAK